MVPNLIDRDGAGHHASCYVIKYVLHFDSVVESGSNIDVAVRERER